MDEEKREIQLARGPTPEETAKAFFAGGGVVQEEFPLSPRRGLVRLGLVLVAIVVIIAVVVAVLWWTSSPVKSPVTPPWSVPSTLSVTPPAGSQVSTTTTSIVSGP
jgi:hypothetical protein